MTPNDPGFGSLWGLQNTGQSPYNGTPGADISAPQAWQATTGSSDVTVAVVDGGITYDHPDLENRIWSNPGETGGGKATNGIDDDGDGLVDDWRGWDFIGQALTGNVPDNDPRDYFGHGTHVSGTIAAQGNNGIGIAGVNWDARVMPLRVCAFHSCTNSAIIDAFTYAGEHGADVVNASLGGGYMSSAERDAIVDHPHTLYVVAAGNAAKDVDAGGTPSTYPCGFDAPNLICVAATDADDALAYYSNWGSTSVDLAAPGSLILSAWPHFTRRFYDGFEGSTPQWDYGEAGDGDDPDHWERTTAEAYTGTHSVTDSAGGDYANDANVMMTLNHPLDLSSYHDCRVQLAYKTDLQPLEDYLHVEASGDGGATWRELTEGRQCNERQVDYHLRRRGPDRRAGLARAATPAARDRLRRLLRRRLHRRRLRLLFGAGRLLRDYQRHLDGDAARGRGRGPGQGGLPGPEPDPDQGRDPRGR